MSPNDEQTIKLTLQSVHLSKFAKSGLGMKCIFLKFDCLGFKIPNDKNSQTTYQEMKISAKFLRKFFPSYKSSDLFSFPFKMLIKNIHKHKLKSREFAGKFLKEWKR